MVISTKWFSFTWDCWSWSRMTRREMEEAEGEMLCTVQQLRRRSGQARDPSRKSSVCRCSTLLSRPSLSSIKEPATKWGSSQGKWLGEEEEEEACTEEGRAEDLDVSSFMEVHVVLELSSGVNECPETGYFTTFVDLCSTSFCSVRSSCGEWGRHVLNNGGLAFSTLGKYSTFLSLLRTYGPLFLPLLCLSVFKLVSLNVLSCSQPYPPPTLWKPSETRETGRNLEGWCGWPGWSPGVPDKWLWCW